MNLKWYLGLFVLTFRGAQSCTVLYNIYYMVAIVTVLLLRLGKTGKGAEAGVENRMKYPSVPDDVLKKFQEVVLLVFRASFYFSRSLSYFSRRPSIFHDLVLFFTTSSYVSRRRPTFHNVVLLFKTSLYFRDLFTLHFPPCIYP